MVVQLVNTSAVEGRRLALQASAFGEHRITQVRDETGGDPVPVDGKFLEVALPPGTSVRLELGVRLFADAPSYAFPWHEAPPGGLRVSDRSAAPRGGWIGNSGDAQVDWAGSPGLTPA